MKKFLLLGHSEHGKDVAAAYMSQAYGISYEGSSQVAIGELRPLLVTLIGETNYKTLYQNRGENLYTLFRNTSHHVNMRTVLHNAINLYNTPDKAALTRLILSRADMYVGLRDLEELKAGVDLFDHILWIHRPGHTKEPFSSFNITLADVEEMAEDKLSLVYNPEDETFFRNIDKAMEEVL